jgi:hypothetical protein
MFPARTARQVLPVHQYGMVCGHAPRKPRWLPDRRAAWEFSIIGRYLSSLVQESARGRSPASRYPPL